ncbi:hypothetical protein [Tautonia rosea]|uniref:hypothetical protein n=1 Tax=Tautonia rosea TaxID=2728037 RepID=UPI001475B515|nr:hypothetical protein [Tautonia rosea]
MEDRSDEAETPPHHGGNLADMLERPDPIAAAALVSSDDELHLKVAHGVNFSPSLGIDLGSSASPLRSAPSVPPLRPSSETDRLESRSHHDDSEGPPPTRSAWPMALLASYASAMTLAFGWLWWTTRRNVPTERPVPNWAAGLDAENKSGRDDGRRADASTVVEPPEPIAEDRIVSLGERVRVDNLDILPLRVSVGPVELKRTRVDGRTERRDGGSGAFRLYLRLRNTSDNVIFAPLDEAFVREPDRRLPETFIQDASGTRTYAYRLPVSSEWEIAGQTFHALRPGEEIETLVLSDTESGNQLDGPLIWRLRLRTAPETTTVVGVTFDESDIEQVD